MHEKTTANQNLHTEEKEENMEIANLSQMKM